MHFDEVSIETLPSFQLIRIRIGPCRAAFSVAPHEILCYYSDRCVSPYQYATIKSRTVTYTRSCRDRLLLTLSRVIPALRGVQWPTSSASSSS